MKGPGKPAHRGVRTVVELLLAAALPAVASAALAGQFGRDTRLTAAASPAAGDRRATMTATVPAGSGDLSVSEALGTKGRGALWVDARPAEGFARGHAPGAVPLTEERWGDQLGGVLERWTPATAVIVYCDAGDCHASERVAARLRDEGLGPVFVLRGGWAELEKALGVGGRRAE